MIPMTVTIVRIGPAVYTSCYGGTGIRTVMIILTDACSR